LRLLKSPCIVVILSAACFGQAPKKRITPNPPLKVSAPFDFHGDSLGEQWIDFQQRHADTGTTCFGSEAILKTHALKVPENLLAPRLPGMAFPPETGILSCVVNPFMSGEDVIVAAKNGAKAQTLVGMPVETEFKFFGDKLFEISIQRHSGKFEDQSAYALIMSAYTAKYGPPDATEPDTYENGFGATFHGETTTWLDPVRSFSIVIIDLHQEAVGVIFTDLESKRKQKKQAKPDDL
jgi:hypothetical protein